MHLSSLGIYHLLLFVLHLVAEHSILASSWQNTEIVIVREVDNLANKNTNNRQPAGSYSFAPL